MDKACVPLKLMQMTTPTASNINPFFFTYLQIEFLLKYVTV